MINDCNYEVLRDVVFSAICGPIPKMVLIFIRNKCAAERLKDIIFDWTNIEPKVWKENYIQYSFTAGNGARIWIYQREKLNFTCGVRANDVIADWDYPLSDFYEILMPMSNLGIGNIYSIRVNDILYHWDKAHEKGMDDIEYWRKVRKEDEDKKPD